MVVALHVLGVGNELDPELIFKVEVLFLLVADHHHDIADASFLQLPDLPLDKHLAANAKSALGAVVRDRRKPAGKARGKYHGVFNPVRRKVILTKIRYRIAFNITSV